MFGLLGGWKLVAVAFVAALAAGAWLYVGSLTRTIRQQAAVIATQTAQLDQAERVNRNNVAAMDALQADLARAEKIAAESRRTASLTRARLEKLTNEVTNVQGDDVPAGPRVRAVLGGLRAGRETGEAAGGNPGGADPGAGGTPDVRTGTAAAGR